MKTGALIAVALGVALLFAGGAEGASTKQAAVPTVRTSIVPPWVYFADAVTVYVDVSYDPALVDPSSLRLQTRFAPWDQIGPEHVAAAENGTLGRRSWRFTLACLSLGCLPRGTSLQRFHLPAVTLTGTARTGAFFTVRRNWPVIKLAGRFRPAQTTGLRPVFRLNSAVPAATYRVAPAPLALALALFGALILVAGLAVGAFELVRWRAGRRGVVAVPPLVRAVELLRQAKSREPADRRRAASLLARTLPRDDNGLASSAAEVAWSPADPAPERLEELARAAETRLAEDR
jgi:hypothetical protein